MPDDLPAKSLAADIVHAEATRVKDRLTRKVNSGNLSALIFVSVVGGTFSYLLVLWATNASQVLSIVAWILFGLIALFTLLMAISGFSLLYAPNKNSDKSKTRE
jgi:amino acid transporter